MIIITFIVWITTQMQMTELVELHLHIQTKPVIYGQDLSLICSSDVQDKTSANAWYWFQNDRILFYGGSPRSDVDIDKFEENKVTENIRKLTIKDFEFSDIQNYKCAHAFNETSLDLDIEAYHFVYLSNRTVLETMLQDNWIIVNVFEVSPVPTCSIIIKNSYIIMKELNVSKDVYLYNVSFQLNAQCDNEDIITNVKCDVGGLNLNKTVNIKCPLSEYKTNPQTLVIAVTTFVLLIAVGIVTIVIMVIVQRKRKQLVPRVIEKVYVADANANTEPLLEIIQSPNSTES